MPQRGKDGRKTEKKKPTCLAAIGSLGIPHPWRKQLANSKMARTSSPLAAPPFFSPACSARDSTVAALDAAAERKLTAAAVSGLQPQPCLDQKGSC